MQTELHQSHLLPKPINTNRYPITDPASKAYRTIVTEVRERLRKTGCARLHEFLKAEVVTTMCKEVEERLDLADSTSSYQNVYLCDDNPD